jgi:hypothetical protein
VTLFYYVIDPSSCFGEELVGWFRFFVCWQVLEFSGGFCPSPLLGVALLCAGARDFLQK